MQSTWAYLLLLATGLTGCASLNQTLHRALYPQPHVAYGRLPAKRSALPLPPSPPDDVTREATIDAGGVAPDTPDSTLIQQDAQAVVVNGISAGKVRALFGQPVTQVSAGPGETWTYRSGNCRVDLYLFPDVSHGGLHVLDHQTKASDDEQTCLRRLTDGHLN